MIRAAARAAEAPSAQASTVRQQPISATVEHQPAASVEQAATVEQQPAAPPSPRHEMMRTLGNGTVEFHDTRADEWKLLTDPVDVMRLSDGTMVEWRFEQPDAARDDPSRLHLVIYEQGYRDNRILVRATDIDTLSPLTLGEAARQELQRHLDVAFEPVGSAGASPVQQQPAAPVAAQRSTLPAGTIRSWLETPSVQIGELEAGGGTAQQPEGTVALVSAEGSSVVFRTSSDGEVEVRVNESDDSWLTLPRRNDRMRLSDGTAIWWHVEQTPESREGLDQPRLHLLVQPQGVPERRASVSVGDGDAEHADLELADVHLQELSARLEQRAAAG